MGDCSTQRVLSEVRWQEARRIGDAFGELDIPIGQVISSEYCRAWQTADLAFHHYTKAADLNFEPADGGDLTLLASLQHEEWAKLAE